MGASSATSSASLKLEVGRRPPAALELDAIVDWVNLRFDDHKKVIEDRIAEVRLEHIRPLQESFAALTASFSDLTMRELARPRQAFREEWPWETASLISFACGVILSVVGALN